MCNYKNTLSLQFCSASWSECFDLQFNPLAISLNSVGEDDNRGSGR